MRRRNSIPPLITDGLIARHDFTDGSGQTASDRSGAGNTIALGITSGVETNDPTWITDGGLSFDGVDDLIQYTNLSQLASMFGYTQGTVEIITRVGNFGVWSDGITRYAMRLAGTNIDIRIFKAAGVNQGTFVRYTSSAGTKSFDYAGLHAEAMYIALSWNHTADRIRGWFNNTDWGSSSGIGTAGSAITTGVYGSALNSPNGPWFGAVHYAMIRTVELQPTQLRQNYTALKALMTARGVPMV